MISVDSAPLASDDVELELWFDSEQVARFPVLFLSSPTRRDLASAIDAEARDDARPGIVVARYLAKPVREDLRRQNVSYVDATGNIWISSVSPLIVIVRDGASSDPWRRRGRPSGSLAGQAAAQVVRSLVDHIPPFGVQEVADAAGVSLPTAYRFVDRFAEDLLIEREPRGPIVRVDWRQLLVRWADDAPFAEVNRTRTFLQPRGVGTIISDLRSRVATPYAATGSIAAAPFAPYADLRLAMLYTDDIDQLAEELGLREMAAGSNVVLAEPRSRIVYEGALDVAGLRIVTQSQAAADLLSGPGRSPSEGIELMNWMEGNPNAWRR
ncbi:MAG TPA: hypothetical protein VNJ54_06640 [Plantibacter sp.]|uniref:hypothetical protein n=2 Tax=unclassified Plantibacter TaxID=2624265 RepID=UPI002B562757|nr:hypothetical protein [Plantibacter sp.]